MVSSFYPEVSSSSIMQIYCNHQRQPSPTSVVLFWGELPGATFCGNQIAKALSKQEGRGSLSKEKIRSIESYRLSTAAGNQHVVSQHHMTSSQTNPAERLGTNSSSVIIHSRFPKRCRHVRKLLPIPRFLGAVAFCGTSLACRNHKRFGSPGICPRRQPEIQRFKAILSRQR